MTKKESELPHLSDGELDLVKRYLSFLITSYGLGSNFQVLIRNQHAQEWYDDESEVLAGVETHETKFSVDLFLCEEWEGLPDQVKQNTLIHEMLHVMHKRLDDVVTDHLDIDWLPQRVIEAGKTVYNREIEMLVDRLSRILSPLLPAWSAAKDMPLLPSVVVEGSHF